ncbi:hypothetical protein LWC34_15100 [Kibdelosporangium philippinense]|uniref:GNAT family N-acetyltransferase n=1 Tax=Kibdelosporangium philippinense TaxID=211113 RepID=A0ABS8ZBU7_9PSEU|nr:hypothetical protein [Kibdelosporangium philippinense]MCE7004151.1 hypothetical protein [Kibdelosporangium philippinense]
MYYPDAVTLQPNANGFLAGIDTSPGCSVKDSFATQDLIGDGFAELFTAQWIHRPPDVAAPALDVRVEEVSTAVELAAWRTGWDDVDVLRPALLDDPSVRVLAFYRGDDLAGGVVLNHSAGVVGVSNLFSVDDSDLWAAAITAASARFPGVSLVGYEHGDDLEAAIEVGFAALGPLRVWYR